MKQVVLDAEAGQISGELARRGIATNAVVHARIEVMRAPELPMGAIAQSGKAFDWLDGETDLYSDDDLVVRPA